MIIKFKKLEIHNFMSFADDVVMFDDFNGIIKINGYNFDDNQRNGSGKSTIANALVYSIYGKLPFDIAKDNIYNRYLEDHNMRVCVYLQSNGTDYKIVSGCKGKSSYCELYEFKDGKENEITKSSMTETRNFIINEIMKVDLNIFMRTIFLNSDTEYNFYHMSKTDKKNFIDKLFNLSSYSRMYDSLHRKNLSSEKNIIALQSQLMVLNKNLDELNENVNVFETSHKERISEMEKTISENEKSLEAKKSKMIKRNTDLIRKCEDAISKMDKKIDGIECDIRNIEMKTITARTNIRNLEKNVKDRKDVIKKHSELHGKLCDDCKGIYSKYHNLDRYTEEVREIEDVKLVKLNSGLDELTKKKESLSTERNDLVSKLSALSDKLNQQNNVYEMEKKDILSLENSISIMKSKLEDEKNQKNPYYDLIDANKKKTDDVNSQLSLAIDEYNYNKTSEMVVSHENLKKFIIGDMVYKLNNRVKYHLHKLGASYEIVFDDTMDVDFVTPEKSGLNYAQFSKGEQARINIATCFAFRDFIASRSGINSNILILDEFFDSNVDTMCLENVMDILGEVIKKDDQKIFVVTHRQEISEDMFNSVLMVEKRNHVSRIKIVDNK